MLLPDDFKEGISEVDLEIKERLRKARKPGKHEICSDSRDICAAFRNAILVQSIYE